MSIPVTSDQDHGGLARVLNLPAPASDNEPARRVDLNSAVEGVAWKDSVRVATPGNVNLASPGANLDGVALDAGDRFLALAQTAPEENGIYVWNGAAVPAARSGDAASAADLEGAVTTVEEGTSGGVTFRQTAVNFDLDTDPVIWTPFGQATPAGTETTAGSLEIATQTETNTGTDDARAITPLKLANWSGRKRKATGLIGDGAATQIDVAHNFGTFDLEASVWEAGGLRRKVLVEIQQPNNNTVRVIFASAPALNSYNVVVIA